MLGVGTVAAAPGAEAGPSPGKTSSDEVRGENSREPEGVSAKASAKTDASAADGASDAVPSGLAPLRNGFSCDGVRVRLC